MRARSRRFGLLVVVAASAACAGRQPEPVTAPVRAGWTQTGVASWYGEPHDGRPTASGEIFDMRAMTAAHRTLPFGTELKVENLDNGRWARVRVNDRGPFVKGRILDVSRAAARALGMLGTGTAHVRLVALGNVGEASPARGGSARADEDGSTAASGSGAFCREVQVGSFSDDENARRMGRGLEDRGEHVHYESGPGGVTRVLVGPFDSEDGARTAADRYDGLVRGC